MQISIMHIGKTGGTALISTLRTLNKDKNLVFHGHALSLGGIWEKFPQRQVVFGVREPISRYISAFNSRLRQGLPRHHTPWSKGEAVAFSLFQTPNALAEALSSSNLYEKAAAELSMCSIKHVNKPLTFYLGGVENLRRNVAKIKFVYLVESLNSDFDILKRLLGIADDVSLPTDEIAAHRTPSGMSKELSDTARENLYRWYQEDIEIYEFCKELHAKRSEEATDAFVT